jgi:predicted nuclease of restriction endonuclease-like (RecB) superfamily
MINNYAQAIKVIKQAILKSRYQAALLVNREMLMLYFSVGEYISKNSREGKWGTNAIEVISSQLQKELPSLRGFSTTNLRNMRLFYEAWQNAIPDTQIHQLATDELHSIDNQKIEGNVIIHQITSDEIINHQMPSDEITIRQIPSDELDTNAILRNFVSIGFSHHIAIINGVKSHEERIFYITNCAVGFWSYEKLKYNIKSNLYAQLGSITNNFVKTISETDFRGKALRSFKDNYLINFVDIEDPDEEDERVIENQIVLNIKKFIMALGNDFTFIGNQHRIIVDDREFFVDLLFFNRQLQSLVAIDLKKKEFKPEHAGKMNFYLSALDEYEKKSHENPSIGIILCKEKSNKIVEFAFRDTSKPMGVATYRTARELPPEYKGFLPDAEKLKELMDE